MSYGGQAGFLCELSGKKHHFCSNCDLSQVRISWKMQVFSSGTFRLVLDAVFQQLRIERCATDSEAPGGFGLVPACLLKHCQDRIFFRSVALAALLPWIRLSPGKLFECCLRKDLRGQVFLLDHIPLTKGTGILDGTFQFTDVARPGIFKETLCDVIGQAFNVLVERFPESADKMAGQQ